METYIVVERWTSSYPEPILLKVGQKVKLDYSIIDDNPQWQDWVWCIAADDKAGWVPVQLLDKITAVSGQLSEAVATEYYSAIELDVEVGEIVSGNRTLNGWLWCSKENGDRGWLPVENVELLK